MFEYVVIKPLLRSLQVYRDCYAFYIGDGFFTYDDLVRAVSKIRISVATIREDNVALVANDDIETYASIIALWLEGKCYVPLHPGQPIDRCNDIISQVGTHYVLDSSAKPRYSAINVINTKALPDAAVNLECSQEYPDDKLAYILFTSGSTGKPKGVPLSRGNLATFVDAFHSLNISIDHNDRCLQMFDLTFDLSVQAYLLPLLVGACVYTVAPDTIKYERVFELLTEQRLTFGMMVPSVIHYLRPYADEIDVPEMRYSLFAGEGLPLDDVEYWSRCLPNARIDNVYGPTENTIYCTDYTFNRDGANKETNGIMCIGKPMRHTHVMIVDDDCRELPEGAKGELCLAGEQLTQGYWNNGEKNRASFFNKDGLRYYRTGDVCSIDADGDIAYYGRNDSQVKIQGYRIELSEIECVARKFYDNKTAVVALPVYDSGRNCTITLAVENADSDTATQLDCYLKKYLPAYMIPSQVRYFEKFPLNVNNKIDRKAIAALL
jgi:D-alanine--poly(phosphoribitol) ligase subunit 1